MTQSIGIVKNGQIKLLNNSFSFPEGTKLLLTPLDQEKERDENNWNNLALEGLNNAYDNDEPEYGLDKIKEFNIEYEAR